MQFLPALIVFGLMLAVCLFGLGKSNHGAKTNNATGSLGRGGRSDDTRSDRHPILQVSEAKPHTSL